MTVVTANSILVIVVIVAAYIFWRNIKGELSSPFRALDLILLTLLVFVSLARTVGLIMGLTVDYEVIQLEQLFNINGVRFEWLALFYAPILAFQLLCISIEVDKKWKQKLFWPFIFAQLLAGVAGAYSLFALYIIDSSELEAKLWYHLGIVLIAIVTLAGLVYLRNKKRLNTVRYALVLGAQHIALQIVVWLAAYISAPEVVRQSLGLLALLAICILPIIAEELKSSPNRDVVNQRRL